VKTAVEGWLPFIKLAVETHTDNCLSAFCRAQPSKLTTAAIAAAAAAAAHVQHHFSSASPPPHPLPSASYAASIPAWQYILKAK
jgi:hypothetical protein